MLIVKVEKWKEDRLKSLDEELASKKQAQRLKTESAKKEYDAKGTGYLDAGGRIRVYVRYRIKGCYFSNARGSLY